MMRNLTGDHYDNSDICVVCQCWGYEDHKPCAEFGPQVGFDPEEGVPAQAQEGNRG